MESEQTFGTLNGHSVGRLLKETVRRAVATVRAERMVFEAHTKQSYAGTMDDVFTSADKHAQEVYLRAFAECFPECGVIAEEDAFRIESKNGAYFTVDPIDGTKAFIRRQSHGVSSMVALVSGGEVVSAYIGDINTHELFGYRPGSDKVHRITDLDIAEDLSALPPRLSDISQMYALLRNPLDDYSPATRILVDRFKNYEVMGSSIGTWAARLWKREVQALFLDKGFETPWDSTPIIGISLKLGYKFFRASEDSVRTWEQFDPVLPTAPYKREHDVLITHPSVLSFDE
jgi:fructose-1,6-bisphosphatase/inositol monophosphatase family enzyme